MRKKIPVSRAHELVTRAHDLVSRAHDLVSRAHDLHLVPTRYNSCARLTGIFFRMSPRLPWPSARRRVFHKRLKTRQVV